jgi:cytoskeletal protein CcmA (bactofilin family)
MKIPRKRTWKAALLGLVVGLAAAVASLSLPAVPAHAMERRSGDSVTIPASETVNDDLFASGQTVRIDGRVRGDVYAFSKSVVVSSSGVIEGDLITAGANVAIDGQVQGNVRAAGASIQLNGAVGRNVLGAAHDIQLGSSGRVGGNMIGAAENVTLAGDVAGSLSGAGNFDLQGNIGRGAELALESLTVGPQARIGGSLTYYADHEQSAIPAGVAAGGVRFVQTQDKHQRETVRRPDQRFGALANVLSLTWLTGTAIVGLVLLRLFPRFAAEFLAVLETQPLPSLGLGVLTLIGTVPVAIVFALTVIGIPVALLMGAGYFSGMLIGWIFLALAAGSILVGLVRKGRPWHPSWAFLLGLVVLYVLTRLPFLGGLVTFVGLSFGLGAFLVALYRTWRGGGEPLTPSGSRPSVIPAVPIG